MGNSIDSPCLKGLDLTESRNYSFSLERGLGQHSLSRGVHLCLQYPCQVAMEPSLEDSEGRTFPDYRSSVLSSLHCWQSVDVSWAGGQLLVLFCGSPTRGKIFYRCWLLALVMSWQPALQGMPKSISGCSGSLMGEVGAM